MKRLEGTLDTVSLRDLLLWAERTVHTGSLSLSRDGISKTFFFQKGALIFASSQKEGERTGEFFARRFGLPKETLFNAIRESIHLNIPFTEYLVSHGIVEPATLSSWITTFIETLLADALGWTTGSFVMTGEVPASVTDGPVKLAISVAMTEALRAAAAEGSPEPADPEPAFREVVRRISEQNLELPVIPDMTYKLTELMRNSHTSLHDVVRLIMSDQVLTSKILKVANSVFYGSLGRITSLQQAIIAMGFKTIEGIVTVHVISRIGVSNNDRMRELLEHSLLCAFIARKTSSQLGLDPEECFVCGLLHDIGKTVILNMTADYAFSKAAVERLLGEYHQKVGSLLMLKWNFSDVIWTAVLYHHNPWDAPANRKVAEVVCLADACAHDATAIDDLVPRLEHIEINKLDLDALRLEIPGIREAARLF